MITPDEQQQITALREILYGMEQGRKWQVKNHDNKWWTDDDQMIASLGYWIRNCNQIRLEPLPPTPRDWNGPEDVFAVGPTCWIRCKLTPDIIHLITSVCKSAVWYNNPAGGGWGSTAFPALAAQFEHSPTGTAPWKPCTVEVRA